MELYSYIDSNYLKGEKNIISLTGGGGKTTFLIGISCYLKNRGKSVLLTTTTKLIRPDRMDYKVDHIFYERDSVLNHRAKKGESVFYAKLLDERKCCAIDPSDIEFLSHLYDVIIIEADGAAFLPLKLHTQKDPVVVKETTLTVMIMGASGFERRVEDVCFGSCKEGFADLSFYQALIDDSEGVLKDARGDGVVIINQCDEFSYEELLNLKCRYKLLFASEREDRIYEVV